MEKELGIRIRADLEKWETIKAKMRSTGIAEEKINNQSTFDFAITNYLEMDEVEKSVNSKMLKLLNSLIEGHLDQIMEKIKKTTTSQLSEISMQQGIMLQFVLHDVLDTMTPAERREKIKQYRIASRSESIQNRTNHHDEEEDK